MSDTQATLEARLRETPLAERLSESTSRIGKMCSEGRCPAMSIPVRETDDDFYISTTIRDAASALAQSQARVAALEAALRRLCNEVGGLAAAEYGVREVIGNTNYTILMQRLDEAQDVLAARDALAGREGGG